MVTLLILRLMRYSIDFLPCYYQPNPEQQREYEEERVLRFRIGGRRIRNIESPESKEDSDYNRYPRVALPQRSGSSKHRFTHRHETHGSQNASNVKQTVCVEVIGFRYRYDCIVPSSRSVENRNAEVESASNRNTKNIRGIDAHRYPKHYPDQA